MTFCSRDNKELECRTFAGSEQLPGEWNGFLPVGHALRQEELLTTERSQLPDVSFLYVLVYHKGKIAAAVYFQYLRARPEHINKSMIRRWQSHAWKLFTKAAHPKLLVAGHLFRHDTSFFYSSPEISSYLAYQCFHSYQLRFAGHLCFCSTGERYACGPCRSFSAPRT
jgi:hypothetical protein